MPSSFSNPVTLDTLTDKTVSLAFDIRDFQTTGIHSEILDQQTKDLVTRVVTHELRPPRLRAQLPRLRSRSRTSASSASQDIGTAPAPSYPPEWVLDRSAFQQAVKEFRQGAEVLLQLVPYQPPSTGSVSAGSPSGSPKSLSAEDPIQNPDPIHPAHRSPPRLTPQLKFRSVTADPVTLRLESSPAPVRTPTISPISDRREIVEDRQETDNEPHVEGMSNNNNNNVITFSKEQFAEMMQSLRAPPLQPPQPVQQPVIKTADKFRPRDIGFFDPNNDADPVETTDNKTIYHNVFSFTERLRVKKGGIDAVEIAQNLDQCLLGKADRWYTSELSDLGRAGLKTNLELWCKELEKRFREAPGVALSKLESLRYTIADVRARRDPEDYIQQIIVTGKNANTAMTEESQVWTAYQHMDAALRVTLPQPGPETSVAVFIQHVASARSNWYDLYKPFTYRSSSKFVKGRSSTSFSSPSFLPSDPASGSFSSDYTSSSSRYQGDRRTSYNKPWEKRSDRPIKQESKQQDYRKSEYRQPQPSSRDTRSKDKAKDNRRGNPKNKNYKRTYHIDDVEKDDSDSENKDPDSEENTYDPEYYHGTPYDDSEPFVEDHDDKSSTDDVEVIDVKFTSSPKPMKQCRICKSTFKSGNDLHKHLKGSHRSTPSSEDVVSRQHTADRSQKDDPIWSSAATAGSSPATKAESPTNEKDPAEVQADSSATKADPSPKRPPEIVTSTAPPSPQDPGYGYRGYRYATAMASIGSPVNDQKSICADSGCVMSLIDRQFLQKYSPTSTVHTMRSRIRVRGVGNRLHEASQYAFVDFYFPTTNGCAAHFRREVHIVDDLSANALIGSDILYPEGWILEIPNEQAVLTHNMGLKVKLTVLTRGEKVRRKIYTGEKISVPPRSRALIPISGPKGQKLDLPDRDMIFEPQNQSLTFFTHIVDKTTAGIVVQNDSDRTLTLSKNRKIGIVVDDDVEGFFVASTEDDILASKRSKTGWKRQMLKGLLAAMAAVDIVKEPTRKETRLDNGVTVYGDESTVSKIDGVVKDFASLWEDRGQQAKIPENEQMQIPLVDNWEEIYKPGQARVYPVGIQDREVVDQTFDKLHEQGRMKWTKKSTPFSFPCFVVWKQTPDGRKGRVVIDIRALNRITIPDAYPIPLQDDIICLVAGCLYISTVDCASFFYQFLVWKSHRYRLTVSSHRGQETFKCALMGYKNTPAFAQRTIDRILRNQRKFARAYIDDIVIFSKTLDEHIAHLKEVFSKLLEYDICLSPKKSFLAYPSVQLLGRRVDALGLATDTDKLSALAHLTFPRTLRQLDHYLGLTGYLRQHIPFYAGISKPLQDRKKRLYRILKERHVKGNARKREAGRTRLLDPTDEEISSFEKLQELFASPEILTHFDPSRTLYIDVDASTEVGFGAYAYHVKAESNGLPKQKSIQPILFLSKLLTPAESRYWPTELEVAGLVWIVKKLRHLIEASHHPTNIYTDHQAIVDIVKQSSLQTTSVVRLNLRHVRSSEYLARFRLDIRHKPGKSNIIPDALSRLPVVDEVKDHLRRQNVSPDGSAYPVAVVEISDDFKQRIRDAYNEDKKCQRLISMIEDNRRLLEDAARLPFKMKRQLLYFDDVELGHRLVIPQSLEKEIFAAAHDQNGHLGYGRTHERLSSHFYIFDMSKKLKTYLAHCPDCSSRRTPRHRPYGSLQPILTPSRPFHTLAIDFILALPISLPDRFDCAMTVTDKFSKAITILAGRSTFAGSDWAVALLDRLHLILWGVPRAIISDRDSKFVGQIWSTIFERLNVHLYFTTAWHPSADGQSERSNQTIEIALRYFLATLDNHAKWPTVLPRLTVALSNSSSRSTSKTSTQILYGRRIREGLDLMRAEDDGPIERLDDYESTEPATDENRRRPIDLTEANRQRRAGSAPAYPATPVPENPKPYLPTHIDARDAIAFASMVMKKQYDGVHLQKFFQVGDWVSLRLHRGYTVPGLKDRNVKIEQQFAGPFKVIEKINPLTYRLQLPPNLRRIHPVISIAHLEAARPPDQDPYHRQPSQQDPVITPDGRIHRPISQLLRKRGAQLRPEYLVRYEGLSEQWDEWKPARDIPEQMRRTFDEQQDRQALERLRPLPFH